MNTIEKPNNYLTLSIVGTLMGCCSPFYIGFLLGLVAIYFSSQVNPRYNENDIESAEKNARYAKTLSFVAIALGVLQLLYTAYIFTFQPEVWQEQIELIKEQIELMQEQQQ